MQTSDFDYFLPPELIAQTPAEQRDSSRLMVLERSSETIRHFHFSDLPELLRAGDLLILNDTRVIPARQRAWKDSGARLEILLLTRIKANLWRAIVKPARRLRPGDGFSVATSPDSKDVVRGTVVQADEGGIRILEFDDDSPLKSMGSLPLPPYIHAPLADPERYQTVYSRVDGSAAAPTAGLHFTPELISTLLIKGVHTAHVTLHVGLDTFQPVREDDPTTHRIHSEFGVISGQASREIVNAKNEGRRVICVGTTSTRLVESACASGRLSAGQDFSDWVELFILPGHEFKVADAMITNFHLPKTSLIMLVSAFAGREFILNSYHIAIEERYRFYSFGDAMLIL